MKTKLFLIVMLLFAVTISCTKNEASNPGKAPSLKSDPVYAISGAIKYANNANTPLNGILLTLKKTSDSSIVGVYNTDLTPGSYQFTGLTNNSYYIEISSTFSGGAWQTWGGVNGTDYLLVLRHTMGTAFLPTTPAVTLEAANVKAPTTTDILTDDANAIRYAYIYNNPALYFDIPKWVFSGPGATPYYFPYNTVAGIVINDANVTLSILGRCAGDVNGSYLPPSGQK